MTKHARRNRRRHDREAAGRPPRVPEALQQACFLFTPEFRDELPPGADPRKWAADNIRPQDVAEVLAYLNGLLDGSRTPEQLQALWRYFNLRFSDPKGAVWLLTGVRDRLIGRPRRPNPGRGTYRHRR